MIGIKSLNIQSQADKKSGNFIKRKKQRYEFKAIKTGTIKYRDDYGNWIAVLQAWDVYNFKKRGMQLKFLGDTQLYRARKNKNSVLVNGFRYRVGMFNPFRKCVGYIVTDKGLVRLTKKFEFYKLIIGCLAVAIIPIIAYYYLNSDDTWNMMMSRVTSTASYRDNFNYDNQTVQTGSYITISNNSYNPVTLQYILYENGIKIYDTGELEPGEEQNLIYSVYFKPGEHNITCETISKSLDGVTVIEDKKKDMVIQVRE